MSIGIDTLNILERHHDQKGIEGPNAGPLTVAMEPEVVISGVAPTMVITMRFPTSMT